MKHQSAVERSDAVGSSFPQPAVLIADADEDTRALYREAFTCAGCQVVEATDGRDALVKAFAHPFSLIVTELTLPFVDGYALCEILRRDPLTAAVPILVVTAEPSRAHAERVQRLGVDCVLLKPAMPESIVGEARRALARPRDVRASSVGAPARANADRPHPDDRRAPLKRGMARIKAHERFATTSPPTPPPVLSCPSCDRALKYERSHVGGVSDRYPEQWDYFVCAGGCGAFQYRPRTRRVRRVE